MHQFNLLPYFGALCLGKNIPLFGKYKNKTKTLCAAIQYRLV